jgi:hypothetical protein
MVETGSSSCVEGYSPATVRDRTFAFDGTVTAIGVSRTNRPGAALPLVAATFSVNRWFRGGSGPTVTVDIERPGSGEDPAPAVEVGTRLLVSGEPRWGGAPLNDAIAWSCGFTRPYDNTTADTWRAVFR